MSVVARLELDLGEQGVVPVALTLGGVGGKAGCALLIAEIPPEALADEIGLQLALARCAPGLAYGVGKLGAFPVGDTPVEVGGSDVA